MTLTNRQRFYYLNDLAKMGGRREELDESEYLTIKGARDWGATWDQVSNALGLGSPKAAQERFDTLGSRVDPHATGPA